MKRVTLDTATAEVKQFIQDLPLEDDAVQLELDGRVVCTVLAPNGMTDSDKLAVIQRGRELVERIRQRNQDVPARTIEREVRQAVNDIRGRKKQ